jgi:hypothetical protein
MAYWQQLRIPFLAFILSSIILILIKIFLSTNISQPKSEQSSSSNYVFTKMPTGYECL